MAKVPPKQRKTKGLSHDELMKLEKEELVDRIMRLEAHNAQLKNIISKKQPDGSEDEKVVRKKEFDFSKCHYRRVLLRLIYFGWDYQGLAVQEDTTQTIEHHLFHALTKACLIESRETANYHRCGRTDKGVSSFGQVISITVRSKHAIDQQNSQECLATEISYCKILNRLLPKDIRAVTWIPIPGDKPDFSARFDCKKRQYKYYFPRSNLDIAAMTAACSLLIGSHDFRHLCKMDVGNGVTEFTRRIFTANILAVDGKDCDDPMSMYYVLIEGNAFLWHQIRCIVGVLILIGQKKEPYTVISELMDVEANPRKPQYSMALDVPLNLFDCSYELPNCQWVYEKEELKTCILHLQGEWTMYSVKTTMIKDCLNRLEETYKELYGKETENRKGEEIEGDSLMAHVDCLLQGVKPRTYIPLLKRETCSSLHERIEYYRKKRKIDIAENKDE